MPTRNASTILAVLRIVRGWSQADLAKAAGVRPATISDWERGKKTPSVPTLERLTAIMGYPTSLVVRADAFVEEATESRSLPAAPADLSGRIEALAVAYGREVADFVRSGLKRLTAEAAALQERCRAPYLWERLRQYGTAESEQWSRSAGSSQNWALCELLCEESIRATADLPERAVELAELALLVAPRVPEEGLHLGLQGYAWAFLGNARRVRGDLRSADEAFGRSAELWQAGSPEVRDLLDGARLMDLEASLRRDQRRLGEALRLLDRALSLKQGEAAGRLLVKKSKTLEELGDPKGAVAALRQAASLIGEDCEPRLRLCIRFNLLVNLCALGSYREAEYLAPTVRALTERLGNRMDLVRLRWLEGRIAAGLGRAAAAVEILREVRGDFARQGIGYDMALVTLELAELLLSERRAGEVKDLARNCAASLGT